VPDAIADPALDRSPVSEASGLGLGHGAAAFAAPIADRAALPHLPQPAVPIPQQIAQALANPGRDPDVPLDLALDPPELGRVRLSFAELNGTLTLTIAVERPETADLMRRHITLLNEEFARAGLDAPSVSISQGGADDRSQSRTAAPMTEAAAREALPDEQAPSHPDHSRSGPRGGLDLRL
jgi:flagellar hook-length control protein FliK